MRKYELMMIIDPTLSDADRKTLLGEIKDELTHQNAKIVVTDEWGVKNLAYKINKSATGYYVLYTIESMGAGFFEITKSFNLKKTIWRHMFVRIED
jgi:small subunit ribosomal protein S6